MLSVPDQTSPLRASGSVCGRMMCGVIDSTISLFVELPLFDENSRPATGTWPRPGTLLAVLRSWSLIRPASTCVSPSFRRSEVCALRVPIW